MKKFLKLFCVFIIITIICSCSTSSAYLEKERWIDGEIPVDAFCESELERNGFTIQDVVEKGLFIKCDSNSINIRGKVIGTKKIFVLGNYHKKNANPFTLNEDYLGSQKWELYCWSSSFTSYGVIGKTRERDENEKFFSGFPPIPYGYPTVPLIFIPKQGEKNLKENFCKKN